MWTLLGEGLAHARVTRGEGPALRALGAGIHIECADTVIVSSGRIPAAVCHTAREPVSTTSPEPTDGVESVNAAGTRIPVNGATSDKSETNVQGSVRPIEGDKDGLFEIVERPSDSDLAIFDAGSRRVAHAFVAPSVSRLAATEEAARGVDLAAVCNDASHPDPSDDASAHPAVQAHVAVRTAAPTSFRDPADRVREMRERRARFSGH